MLGENRGVVFQLHFHAFGTGVGGRHLLDLLAVDTVRGQFSRIYNLFPPSLWPSVLPVAAYPPGTNQAF